MNVLGIIPARGGSKAIPRKNLVLLKGRPLITYTFDAVRSSTSLNRVVISTDDREIADFARNEGMSVPFLRPEALSRDDTPMLPVIQHAVSWLEEEAGFAADFIVLLQPTSPLRQGADIDRVVELLISTDVDTVVSVVEVPHQFTPPSLMEFKDGCLEFGSVTAPLRRQDKVRFYARNGPAILALGRSVLNQGRLYGNKVLPFVMPSERSVDIDSPIDLALAEFWLDRSI